MWFSWPSPFVGLFVLLKTKIFVVHVGFKLSAVLPLPSEHWNYRLALPRSTKRALVCYGCLVEGIEAELSHQPLLSPRYLEVSYYI